MFDPRRIVLAGVVLLTLLAAVPQVAAAKGLAPFDATTKETVVVAACGPNVCIANTGTGHATFLGKVRETGGFTIDPSSVPAPGCNLNTGTLTLTSSNGDPITLSLHGTNCQFTPASGTALEFYTVTGGTGRFRGATGSGTEIVQIDTTHPAVPKSVTDFDGTLSQPNEVS